MRAARSAVARSRLPGIAVLSLIAGDARETALAVFGEAYRSEPLVLDKWFSIQATIPDADTFERIAALTRHPAFSMTNPNRVRALIGSFSIGNPTQFNRADGRGYDLVADAVIAIDSSNPQLAARLLTAFGSWRMLEPGRGIVAKATLERIRDAGSLSRDVADILGRTLADRPSP